jgi:hypothetical protein
MWENSKLVNCIKILSEKHLLYSPQYHQGGAKCNLSALWWQNCWPGCSFTSSCWTQNGENKIQILNLYVNIQMTYSARKALLNNKKFCIDFPILSCTKTHFKHSAKGDGMLFPRCSKLVLMTQPWTML